MRVFVFGTRGFPNIQGGVEKHCENMYSRLANELDITVFRRKAYIKHQDESAFAKIRFIDFPSTKIKGFEALFHSFLCALYCIFKRPDIVHIHNIGPGFFAPILRLFRLKVVITYHSPNYEHDKWSKIEKLFLKECETLSLKYANAVIFVNKKQQAIFDNRIVSKSVVIPNGIEILPKQIKPHYISELGLVQHNYILAVGRITEEKGFDYLIESYARLRKENENLKLVIAGGIDHGSKYAKKLEEIGEKEGVVFTGYVDGIKLQELYSFARIFAFPSYNEGHPLALLEAISYNIPILASNILPNIELALPEDRYFNVGSVEDLSEKLELELKKEFNEFKYNISLYSWRDVADKTLEVYKKL